MSRATRIEYPGALYYAMGRTIGGTKAFPEDEYRERFLRFLGRRVESGDLIVHAFCLLPTQYHLLLETPRGELSRWMQGILGGFDQWFNVRNGRAVHLWQGRYKAILVERGPSLLECSRYIHLHPNRAGLSRPAERRKWSSYRNYVGGAGKPAVPWVTTRTVLGELGASGASGNQARRAYRAYVEAGEGEAPVSPWERATAGLVLGSESFVAWVKDQVKGRPLNADEPSLRRLRREGLPSPDRIEEAVTAEFGDPRIKGPARRILAALLVQCSSLCPSEVARELGVTPGAISRSVPKKGGSRPFTPELSRKLRAMATRLSLRSKI